MASSSGDSNKGFLSAVGQALAADPMEYTPTPDSKSDLRLTETETNRLMQLNQKIDDELKEKAKSIDSNALKTTAREILECNDREKVHSILKSKNSSELRALAKELDIYVLSKENHDLLLKRIVESTIGSKLRTKTIHALDLRSNGVRGIAERFNVDGNERRH